MQDGTPAGSRKAADPEARLAARITRAVDRRLRMLALIRGESLSAVLTSTLDGALPSADELAAELRGSPAQEAVA